MSLGRWDFRDGATNWQQLTRERRVVDGSMTVYDITYTYDQLGNRTEKIDYAVDVKTCYVYDTDWDPDSGENGAWETGLCFTPDGPPEYPTCNNRLLEYREYAGDGQGGWMAAVRAVRYTYYKTGHVCNITLKDEYTGVGDPDDYDWHYDLAMYNATNGSLWRVLWDKWKMDGDQVTDYTPLAAREFYYDGPRQRYLSRDVDEQTWLPTGTWLWTDYSGQLPYGDFTTTGGSAVSEETRYLAGFGIHAQQTVSTVETRYLHDANGNVGQLVAWASGFGGATGDEWHADRLVAHYEYDPYGNVVNDISGYAYAEENPYRFSTKPFDNETGLGCWIFRYYDPRTGRWISRDRLNEQGGLNLHGALANSPLNAVDPDGAIVYYLATKVSWSYVKTHGTWPFTWKKAHVAGTTANVANIDSHCCCEVRYNGFTDYSTNAYVAKYRFSWLRVKHDFETLATANVSSGACTCRGKTVDGIELTVYHIYRAGGEVTYSFVAGVDVKLGKIGAEIRVPPTKGQVRSIWKILICPSETDYGRPSAQLLSVIDKDSLEMQVLAKSGPFWWDGESTSSDPYFWEEPTLILGDPD